MFHILAISMQPESICKYCIYLCTWAYLKAYRYLIFTCSRVCVYVSGGLRSTRGMNGSLHLSSFVSTGLTDISLLNICTDSGRHPQHRAVCALGLKCSHQCYTQLYSNMSSTMWARFIKHSKCVCLNQGGL